MPDTTISEVNAFIRRSATKDDLDLIADAIKAARTRLIAETGAKLTVGTKVSISGISPKYLNGLTGTVTSMRGNRFELLLDESSTNRVRGTKHGPYDYPGNTENVKRHPLRGIPLACAVIE